MQEALPVTLVFGCGDIKQSGLPESGRFFIINNLLEVLLISMLRSGSLSVVPDNSRLLNRECTQIKNYLELCGKPVKNKTVTKSPAGRRSARWNRKWIPAGIFLPVFVSVTDS